MAIPISEMKARLLNKYPASRLELLTSAEIDTIRNHFPGIPEDFLQYLAFVGHGRIGEWTFMVYSGPCQPNEIYDSTTAENLAGLVLVGDNFSGDCVAYDTTNNWQIGEVDSSNRFQPFEGGIARFVDLIKERFLEDL